jgi:hypothetical protein
MSKVISLRFEPGMDILLQDCKGKLSLHEVRPVTKAEVVENAVAFYEAALTSGRFPKILTMLESDYKKNLALARGINREAGGKEKAKNA